MPDRSKTHHFLPQLILRGFANRREQITTLDLTSGRSFPQAISKAGAENDWNTLRLENGEVSDVAERTISELVEGPAASVLDRIRSGGWIESDEERAALAQFVAFQMIRVPRHREHGNAVADLLLRLQVAAGGLQQLRAAMTAQTGREPTEEEVRAQWASVTDPGAWSTELPREQHVLESLDQVEGFGRILEGAYSWAVIRWQDNTMLTSDSPLILVPAPDTPTFYGVGLGTAGSVYFSIGTHCTLVLYNRAVLEVDDGFEREPQADVALSLNRAAVRSARRWVYHHPDNTLSELVGDGFELPLPGPITFNEGHNAKLLQALTQAAEWHADHPDDPHPFSRMPEPPATSPGARPLRRPRSQDG